MWLGTTAGPGTPTRSNPGATTHVHAYTVAANSHPGANGYTNFANPHADTSQYAECAKHTAACSFRHAYTCAAHADARPAHSYARPGYADAAPPHTQYYGRACGNAGSGSSL